MILSSEIFHLLRWFHASCHWMLRDTFNRDIYLRQVSFFFLQVRSRLNVNSQAVKGGLRTAAIVRSTATFTHQTNRTIVEWMVVTSRILIPVRYANTWRYVSIKVELGNVGIRRVCPCSDDNEDIIQRKPIENQWKSPCPSFGRMKNRWREINREWLIESIVSRRVLFHNFSNVSCVSSRHRIPRNFYNYLKFKWNVSLNHARS